MNKHLRSSRWVTLILLLGMFCIAGATLMWSNTTSKQTLNQEVKTVASQFRCPICGAGESVYDSPVEFATTIRRVIRQRLSQGQSESHVKAYLISRYGDWLLLAPPVSGIGLLLWFGPLALLITGLALIAVATLRWRKNREGPLVQSDIVTDEDADAVRDSLRSRMELGEPAASGAGAEMSVDAPAKRPISRKASETLGLQIAGMIAACVLVGAIVSLIYQPEFSTQAQGITLSAALAKAQHKVSLHPRSPKDWQVLAQLEMLDAQTHGKPALYRKAVASYRTLVRLQPTTQNRIELAYLLVGLREPNQALAVLAQTGKVSSVKVLMLEGLAYQELGRKGQAISDFRQFLHAAPKDPLAPHVRKWLKKLES